MADEKYNTRNPAVKRILQEVREMQNNGGDDFMSLPVQDNIFEWQFAIRGPVETEFEGGIYHGRIQLPPEYPFRPPAFMLLTPNGRFETHTKICLSISQHHPEHWQPSWSVRTALVALIAFMPTKPDGALGSLDYTKEERRGLAIKSRATAPKFGNTERQQLIDEIHECMLKNAPPVPTVPSPAVEPAPRVPSPVVETVPSVPAATSCDENAASLGKSGTNDHADTVPEVSNTNAHEAHANYDTGSKRSMDAKDVPPICTGSLTTDDARDMQAATTSPPVAHVPVHSNSPPVEELGRPRLRIDNRGFFARLGLTDDLGLTLLAIGLTVAIIAIFMKKVLTIYWIPTITDS